MTGSIDPTRPQFDGFKALPRDTPIQMLNLIRLKPLADYPPDHPDHGKGVTGLEAYRAYGRTSAAIFARLGARQVWVGRPETVVTGPPDERWDLAFIAEYPSAGAFLAMVTDAEYRKHVKHRTAAVEDSRLIRLAPMSPGDTFGEQRRRVVAPLAARRPIAYIRGFLMDETRLKRLQFRAWRRGFREADLILGPFADNRAPSLTDDQTLVFEQLLDLPDHDVYGWIVSEAAPPPFATDVIGLIRAFHASGPHPRSPHT